MQLSELRLYDRQIRAWGAELQAKIRGASVAVCGSSLAAAELAKNLVLCGFGEVLVHRTLLSSLGWMEDPSRYRNLGIIDSWENGVVSGREMWLVVEQCAFAQALPTRVESMHRIFCFGLSGAASQIRIDVLAGNADESVTGRESDCVPPASLSPIDQFEVGDILTYRFMAAFGELCGKPVDDVRGWETEYIVHDSVLQTWRSQARSRG